MSMSKAVILGGGYIGKKLKGSPHLDSLPLIRKEIIDYTTKEGMENICKEYNPEFIINTYGYTGSPNVDGCEKNKEECITRNIIHNVAILTNSPVPVITVSSGCIYNDDTGTRTFSEEDEPNFGYKNPTASFYSSTKSKFNEIFLNTFSDSHFLLRIRMPFDEHLDDPKNYLGKLLKYDKLVNYENSVTHLGDLARIIGHIISDETSWKSNTPIERGIYNVVSPKSINTDKILNICKDLHIIQTSPGIYYNVDEMLSMGLMTCRRSNCILDTRKLTQNFPFIHESAELRVKQCLLQAIQNKFKK